MSEVHYPRIRVIVPAPTDENPVAEGIFTRVEVDGEPWAVLGYQIDGTAKGYQKVVLVLHADVTVEHAE